MDDLGSLLFSHYPGSVPDPSLTSAPAFVPSTPAPAPNPTRQSTGAGTGLAARAGRFAHNATHGQAQAQSHAQAYAYNMRPPEAPSAPVPPQVAPQPPSCRPAPQSQTQPILLAPFKFGGPVTVNVVQNGNMKPEALKGQQGRRGGYFSDGLRRIDMILVFEDDLDFTKEERRRTFLKTLAGEGLEIETVAHSQGRLLADTGAQDEGGFHVPPPTALKKVEIQHFIKIYAPWSVLAKYAEIMNIKMPIREKRDVIAVELGTEPPMTPAEGPNASMWAKVKDLVYFDYNRDRLPQPTAYLMATFDRHKEKHFLIQDKETFFSSAQRIQIVWEVLTRQCGLRQLLTDGTFQAAYPLHDGPFDVEQPGEAPNDRRLLYTEWAHGSNWYKRQPLWLIRRYFGDKVGLYFAWIGFYTWMLIPASIAGLLCFLFGVATVGSDYNAPTKEICDPSIGGSIVMCPLCGHCRVWKLDDSCTFSKLTYFFDNPATMFFALFMAFWATTFLEFWKRRQAVLDWEWDLASYEVSEDPRPEFEAAMQKFPGGRVPFWGKAARMLAVSAIVMLLVAIMTATVLGIIIYRLVMMSVLYTTAKAEGSNEFLKDNAKIMASMSAAFLNLLIVLLLHDRVYLNIALWLTNTEFPRTQTEYEDSFTFKMFLFQFINYYSSLVYVAFFKGRFFRHPGDDSDNALEKIRGDMCDPAGCLSELFIQLATIMIGKQFVDNFMEIFMPRAAHWLKYKSKAVTATVTKTVSTVTAPLHLFHGHSGATAGADSGAGDEPVSLTRWEQDYNLAQVGQLALFDEYLEMVIQYGFVTLFVAAFPLAPLCALLNNIAEIRLDAYKWTTRLRRPIAERVGDIGAWYGILQGITYASVVTNAFVIAYTSDIIPRLVYRYTNDLPIDALEEGAASLTGYINSSLSIYPTAAFKVDQRVIEGVEHEFCRYRGYYNPPDDPHPFQASIRFWHVLAARLTFVAVFEHLAFALTGLMAFAIPDVPKEVVRQMEHEKMVANETLHDHDHDHSQDGSTEEERTGNKS